MSDYDTAKERLRLAEVALQRWGKTLNNQRRFYPVCKAEWNRAFDRRESAREATLRADPQRFVSDFPSVAWLATYHGLNQS
jgi:hypothetical protein